MHKPDISATQERILDAAYALVARVGVRKTTFEDVALKASVSRQTVYRYFPNKEELVRALMDREAERFFIALERAVPGEVDLERALERSLVFTLDYIGTHPLLSWVYENEPTELLPHLTVHWAPILDAARLFLKPYIDREVESGRLSRARAKVAGDWITRVGISYLISPSEIVNLRDPRSVRKWVPGLILYGLAGPSKVDG